MILRLFIRLWDKMKGWFAGGISGLSVARLEQAWGKKRSDKKQWVGVLKLLELCWIIFVVIVGFEQAVQLSNNYRPRCCLIFKIALVWFIIKGKLLENKVLLRWIFIAQNWLLCMQIEFE